MTTGADVTACIAIHSATATVRCSDCHICAECDVTIDVDEYGEIRCESCLNDHEQERLEKFLMWSPDMDTR